METLRLNEVQTYFDNETEEPLSLCFEDYFCVIANKEVHLSNVPLLKNNDNGKIYFPDKIKLEIASFLKKADEQNEDKIYLSPKRRGNKRYHYAAKYDFKYSSIDYEYIPGLYREFNEGFLTPVYFNISVLNKYSQNPDYSLDLFSSTYGTISYKDEWNIQFGVNKNKNIIMWLGDIDSLHEEEKYYLRSENINSDHCIHSEFYNAQIDVKWADPCLENRVFRLRNDLSQLTKKLYQTPFYMLEGEVSDVISNLDKPIFWEDKHVSPVVESLNRIFVESLNTNGIKTIIKEQKPDIDTKGKKGLKLFSLYIEHILDKNNFNELMCPFFVLYDFRIMVCHLQSTNTKEEQLKGINKRLSIDEDNKSYEQIYDRLFSEMEKSYNEILNKY